MPFLCVLYQELVHECKLPVYLARSSSSSTPARVSSLVPSMASGSSSIDIQALNNAFSLFTNVVQQVVSSQTPVSSALGPSASSS